MLLLATSFLIKSHLTSKVLQINYNESFHRLRPPPHLLGAEKALHALFSS